MIKRSTRLRWRRRLKLGKHHVEIFSVQAEKRIEGDFFKRLPKLQNVRRFVVGWVMLTATLIVGVVLQVRALSPYYQTAQPTGGGIYTEGILGSFTTANPLYATSSVDASVSRLLFASLMKMDGNDRLVPDLAEAVTADERGLVYTVKLKPDIYWHDNQSLTADDVVFTYQLVQNPDAKSPLLSNWHGTKIEKQDDRTVVFTLPHPLISFPNLLTTGLVPKHVLGKIPPSQLRTAGFNTATPIGSGPFMWDGIQITGQTPETREEQIGLLANPAYHSGKPQLDRIIVKAIRTETGLIEQFKRQELDGIVGQERLPKEMKQNTDLNGFNVPINAEVMIFLKTTSEPLQDKIVRQALVKATDTKEIITGLGYPVIGAKSPLLKSHLGFAENVTQFDFNKAEAEQLLEQNGWLRQADGIRSKEEKQLSFQLTSQNSTDYAYITQVLQRQWRDIGVKVDVNLQSESDLQTSIALHSYDALLYGITLGNDPDIYAYWHSSQADVRSSNRLNFAEFKSKVVDSALEGGRTRADGELRALKYLPFLQTWREEAPAIALYQPRLYYVTRGQIYGFNVTRVNVATDRYANVHNWQIRTERITRR